MTEIAHLRRELVAGRERLLRSIAGVSEEQFKRRPPATADDPSPWCIAEVLAHLLTADNIWLRRIRLALSDDGAVVAPTPPEAHEAGARAGRLAPVPQLVHGLLASRREFEQIIASAEPGDWERHVTHPERGRLTLQWMIQAYAIDHTTEHAAQIEALRLVVGAPPVSAS